MYDEETDNQQPPKTDTSQVAPASEQPLWTGRPSQVVNLKPFGLHALLAAVVVTAVVVLARHTSLSWSVLIWILALLLIPIGMAAWKWLVVRYTIYELTSQRLRLRRGVINKRVDQLELYRVKDYRVDEPLFLRMASLSNVVLETSDKTDPVLVLAAVRDGETIQNLIRNQVEHLRDRKRVREIDFD